MTCAVTFLSRKSLRVIVLIKFLSGFSWPVSRFLRVQSHEEPEAILNFDTRVRAPRIPGLPRCSAAAHESHRLRHAAAHSV